MEISYPLHEKESKIEYKEPKELKVKEAQTEIESKVDHERIKEPKELQEKEAQIANQKLKLSSKLGSLTRVQPINRSSIMKGEKISRGIFMSSQHSINEFKHCLQI